MVSACSGAPEGAASPPPDAPWFGVALPPAFDPEAMQVESGRPAAPAVVPQGEARFSELEGTRIARDLATIVGISTESRETHEIGDGQLWGRVTGFPSGAKVIEWAAAQFRDAGLNVEVQPFQQDAQASMWLPLSWEVRLKASPAFGVGSQDIVLESAMPLSDGGFPESGLLRAPLVYVGEAAPAVLERLDVRGKVAVQHGIPQGHTVFLRPTAGPSAEDLLERGALAVLTLMDLPGNMRSRDVGCGGGACFNIGGRDGHFLTSVMNAAAEAGVVEEIEVEIRLESERVSGLSAQNAVATKRGTTRPGEYIILNAHSDAWFDGAGDNGDGLAVLVALARHFARPEIQTQRSLLFIASAGHHSSGLSGPGHFVAMNPDVIEHTVLTVNLEHTSQRHITPAREYFDDGYQKWVMDSRESPIVAAMGDGHALLEDLLRRGVQRYGTNFVSDHNTSACGDCGSFRATGTAVLTTMQGPPMYHTTGEILEMISVPGLERMARFMSFFVQEADSAPTETINPM
jgi:hypothetical protein